MNYLITQDDLLYLVANKAIKGWVKHLSPEEFKNSLKYFKPYYHTLPDNVGLQVLFFKLFHFALTGHRRIEPQFLTLRSGDVFLIINAKGVPLKQNYGERKFAELCENGRIGLFSLSVLEVVEKW